MVYFIQAGFKGCIKIGFAIDPENRLRQLQTANHEKLDLFRTWPRTK